jgi:MFS family permease
MLGVSLIIGINWFCIAAIYPYIASDLGLNLSGLGQISGSFLIGIGATQLPASVLSARIGLKNSVALGLIVTSIGSIALVFLNSLAGLVIARLIIGIALAFVFSPGIGLTASFFDTGSKGFAIGLYNVLWLAGSVVALLGEAVLPAAIGWRSTLVLNGIVGLGISGVVVATLPRSQSVEKSSEELMAYDHLSGQDIKTLFLNKWVLLIGITLLGVGIANTTAISFMVYYVETHFDASAFVAGSAAMLIPLFGIASSLVFGRLYDTAGRVRSLLLLAGFATAFGLSLLAINSLYAAFLAAMVIGFFGSAGFTIGVASVRTVKGFTNSKFEVIGTSWVIALLLFGTFVGPIFFSDVASTNGYESGWLLTTLFSAMFFIPMLTAKSFGAKSVA